MEAGAGGGGGGGGVSCKSGKSPANVGLCPTKKKLEVGKYLTRSPIRILRI